MVTDIWAIAQKRGAGDHWITVDIADFFQNSSYRLFAWLVGVRNYAGITPLSEPRGLPEDYPIADERWEHDISWLSMDEIIQVDFDNIVEDRRCSGIDPATGIRWGNLTCEPGEGKKMPLRDFLGEGVMQDIDKATALGVERIVFGFNS